MKKILFAFLIATAMLLSACGNEVAQDETPPIEGGNVEGEIDNNTEGQEQDDSKSETNEDTAEQDTSEDTPDGFDYEDAFVSAYGMANLEGRAFMRADDQEINGTICAVFKVGTNTPERFVTEQWLAVSQDGVLYSYDVAADLWSEYTGDTAPDADFTVSAENCIYMLNELLSDNYSVEYYDTPDMLKKALYQSEDSFNQNDLPVQLVSIDAEVSGEFFEDPSSAIYYPIHNFSSLEELKEHYSTYFTESYIEGLSLVFKYNFLEYGDTLYLVRGGMGYGEVSIDFDNLDYSSVINDTMIVPTFIFGEDYGDYIVEFTTEQGIWKIDSSNYIANYDLINISDVFSGVDLADFLAFTTDNLEITPPDDFEPNGAVPNAYTITYYGDYHELLPKYSTLLKLQGFTATIDGYEGFYNFEKLVDGGLLTVNAYFINDENNITLEILLAPSVG